VTYVYPTIEEMLYRYVFPVVKFREIGEGSYQPLAAVGTGFTFGEGTFVTCWHCVPGDIGTDEFYGVPYGDDMSCPDKVAILSNILRARSGADLATATIAIGSEPKLRLSALPARWGSDVLGLGFPHPVNTINPATNEPLIFTQSRALKGYVSAVATHSTGGAREAKYYELGMAVPMWASGSPLMDAGTLEIVGVLAGERTSEVGRSGEFTVGLALHLDVLREAVDSSIPT
jgi:hypothetical protein